MKHRLCLPALTMAGALALSGCGGPGNQPAATAPAAPSTAAAPSTSAAPSMSTPSASTAPSTEHNSADVMFARKMIRHHQQGIQLSDMVLGKDGIDPKITDLAARIKAAEAPEVQTMQGWLDAWNAPPGQTNSPSACTGNQNRGGNPSPGEGGIPGRICQDDINRLEGAQGTEAGKLFLTLMTDHHEGGVQLAEEEERDGVNPDAVTLAKKIIKDQQAEIKEMKDLLARL